MHPYENNTMTTNELLAALRAAAIAGDAKARAFLKSAIGISLQRRNRH